MNPSYVFLVALLVAATAAIYGTYLYMLDKAKDFHTEDIAAAIKTLLDIEPGQTKTAHVAIPHGTTIKICPDKECRCGAPTCIVITGPTTTATIPTTAKVILPTQTGYVIPAGTYIIKARAEPPDLDKITTCRIAYQAVADIRNLLTNACQQTVHDVITQITSELEQNQVIQLLLENFDISQIISSLGNPCDNLEKVPDAIYRYFCVTKKIYLEIYTT